MNFIQETCNQIVIPPKLKYSSMDLGYAISTHGRRHDFQVRNNDNQNLKCSLYIPKQLHPSKLCVMYLHSMNGSRLECLSYVDMVLARGFYLCSFDFSGCGNSEGSCISFGANQKYDIGAVTEYLVGKYGVRRYVLWGRSMGAVAGLKYCEMMMENRTEVEIHGIVLDSPFQSLKKLIIELGAKRSNLPQFCVHAFYFLIQSTLQKKAKFAIDDLQLVKTITKIQGIAINFMVSKDDITIDSSHSQALYSAYRYWDKKIVYFTGLHNESRDEEYVGSVMGFLEERRRRAGEARNSGGSGLVGGKSGRMGYKRVMLEQQILRNNIAEIQTNQECECNMFRSPRLH